MSDRKRKRSRFDKNARKQEKAEDSESVDETSPVIILFREYQRELDHKHDKHERIVKLSRDITIESKRIIFLLHRVTGSPDQDSILKQANEKLLLVETTLFKKIAEELVDAGGHQFMKAYSPGLQEYIEGLTFYHYIKDKKLLSLSQVQQRLTFKEGDTATKECTEEKSNTDGESTKDDGMESSVEALEISDHAQDEPEKNEAIIVPIPPEEYILGLADLTGELMRIAINSVGSGDLDVPFQICTFLQEMERGYGSLGYSSREVNRKVFTLRQSLRKVESACYTLQVRGSEIPKHMLVDMLSKDSSVQYGMDESLIEDD